MVEHHAYHNIDEVEELIIEWGEEKGILPNPDPLAQLDKTIEEVRELGDAILDQDEAGARDAIGDIVVTLIMQCGYWGFDLQECLEAAYSEIKCRTGKMVDGQFVKD
jgi:NTP pyrophosphatase (non-canonical NTP hydrolase)